MLTPDNEEDCPCRIFGKVVVWVSSSSPLDRDVVIVICGFTPAIWLFITRGSDILKGLPAVSITPSITNTEVSPFARIIQLKFALRTQGTGSPCIHPKSFSNPVRKSSLITAEFALILGRRVRRTVLGAPGT
jgi:hypothetical protein